LMGMWLAEEAEAYPSEQTTCPHCGGEAGYVRRREGQVITALGSVDISSI